MFFPKLFSRSTNEEARLSELQQYSILDSPPEQAFDEIAKSAAQVCDAPMAFISFVDRDREWFKATVGIEETEISRQNSLWNYVIQERKIFIIPDAIADQKFSEHPLVTNYPYLRFYAAVPLVNRKRYVIGSIGVIDYLPRTLTSVQVEALSRLAQQVIELLDWRRNLREITHYQPQQSKQLGATFLNKISLGFGITSIILLMINFLYVKNNNQFYQSEYWVSHTRNVIENLLITQSELRRVDAKARAYLITGNTTFLEQYYIGVTNIQNSTNIIGTLTQDNQSQQERVRQIRPLIQEKVNFTEQVVSVRQTQGFPQAAQLVSQGRGIALSRRIEEVIDEMRNEEDRLLTLRSQQATDNLRYANYFVIIGTLSTLIILISTYYVIYLEISKRKQTEVDLEQQRNFIDGVLNTAQALVVVLNPRGQIIRCNKAFQEMSGYSFFEIKNKYFWEVGFSDTEENLIKEKFQNLQYTQYNSQYEAIYLTKAGDEYIVDWSNKALLDVNGNIINIINTGIDITDRKRASSDLQKQREFLQVTLASIGDAVVAINNKAQVIFINSAAEKLMGWKQQEVLEGLVDRYVKFVDLKNKEPLANPIHVALKEQRNVVVEREAGLLSRTNHIIPVDKSCAPIVDGNEEVIGAVMIFRDITDQKQAEAELQNSLIKEKEINELKNGFVSMTSHEFRNPLTTIFSSTELLQFYPHKLSDTKKNDLFNQIKAATKRLLDLLDDLLMFNKIEANKVDFNPQSIDLQAICETIVSEMQTGAASQHQIVFSQSSNCEQAVMDEKVLRHIIGNLLSNAIKYSPSGGVVEFALVCSDRTATFIIKDSGIGIPEKDLPKLFDLFNRASNVANIQGTGLGLAIVKRMVDLHQGSITVDSQEGLGTTFTVEIPLNPSNVRSPNS